MSHHGYNPEQEKAMELLNQGLLKQLQRKAEGEFPAGRLNPDDQGALTVGIGHQGGKVVITFPKSVTWIGFTPEQAVEIAETLIQHARACGCTKPLEIKIG